MMPGNRNNFASETAAVLKGSANGHDRVGCDFVDDLRVATQQHQHAGTVVCQGQVRAQAD